LDHPIDENTIKTYEDNDNKNDLDIYPLDDDIPLEYHISDSEAIFSDNDSIDTSEIGEECDSQTDEHSDLR
jgi:hypothetical protein